MRDVKQMNLEAYFKRIGFTGTPRVDLVTLNALMGAHVRAIPFENLDIYSERGVSPEIEAIYDKIVVRGRGGWCYEMNGLFEWVLREIGFDVQRLSAGVRRSTQGDAALGNHLCLQVTLDQPYLVDVGFGSSQLSALPLVEDVSKHYPINIALARIEDGFWRLHEGGPGSAVSYDFKPGWSDKDLLRAHHERQVTDPKSIFRKTLVAKIRRGDDYLILRGLVFDFRKPGWKDTKLLNTPEQVSEILSDVFGLVEPDLERLWPMMTKRHRKLWPHAEGGQLD